MNDGRYDSDWPGGVFFPQRRCVSLLCLQLMLTSVHFPVLSKTVSFFQTGHPVATLPLCALYSHGVSFALLQESTENNSARRPTGTKSNTDRATSSTDGKRRVANEGGNSFCEVPVYLPLSPGAPGGPVKPNPA